MNCTTCDDKVCRKQQTSCNRESFDETEVISEYQDISNSEIVKAAAELVDSGRAGTLSRIQEIISCMRESVPALPESTSSAAAFTISLFEISWYSLITSVSSKLSRLQEVCCFRHTLSSHVVQFI